jgi:hypothetical protein
MTTANDPAGDPTMRPTTTTGRPPSTEEGPTLEQDAGELIGPEADELPARPRRRLVTPLAVALATALVAAGGFVGGVEVQKGQGTAAASPAGGAATGQGQGRNGGAFGRAGGDAGASPTIGTVANKHGSTLYVTDSSGNTVRVKTSKAKVTRTASTSAGAVHPGDTVVVQGTKAGDGTVTASQVTASEKGASPFGGAGRGGFGPPGAGGGQGGSGGGSRAPQTFVVPPGG